MSRCPAVTDLASGRDTLHIYIPHTERGRNAGWLSSPTTTCSKLLPMLLKLLHLSSFLPLCVTSLRSSSDFSHFLLFFLSDSESLTVAPTVAELFYESPAVQSVSTGG